MGKTKIEWTRGDDGSLGRTWNPVRGCSRVSEGCRHCYAETMAARFSGAGMPYEGLATRSPARWTGKVRLVEEHLNDPLKWRKPQRVFVNSMSDLFHENLSDCAVLSIFTVMGRAPQHTFQILTKRPARMKAMVEWIGRKFADDDEGQQWTWPLPNVWLGVSIEDQKTADERIPLLLQTPAAVRFISAEPLLAPVDLRNLRPDGINFTLDALTGHGRHLLGFTGEAAKLDWVIVGGESGPGARPCDISNIRSIVEQCKAAGVSCFVKQLGAKPFMGVKGFGPVIRDRKGGDINEWPEDLRVRQFPAPR